MFPRIFNDIMIHGPKVLRMASWEAFYGCHSRIGFGKSYTLHHQSNDLFYGFIDKISVREEGHILLISRLPQRRLLEHFDLNRVESYWITTQDVAGSIQPSIEQLKDLINSRIENHNGVAIIEGIEWLISLYGFADVLNLVMKIKDNLHRKPWSILFVVTEGVFSEIEYANGIESHYGLYLLPNP